MQIMFLLFGGIDINETKTHNSTKIDFQQSKWNRLREIIQELYPLTAGRNYAENPERENFFLFDAKGRWKNITLIRAVVEESSFSYAQDTIEYKKENVIVSLKITEGEKRKRRTFVFKLSNFEPNSSCIDSTMNFSNSDPVEVILLLDKIKIYDIQLQS